MTRSFGSLLARVGFLVGLAMLVAACPESNSCNGNNNCNVGGNPLAPGTELSLKIYTVNKRISAIANGCRMEVTFGVTSVPAGVALNVEWWKTSSPASITPQADRTQATWVATVPGKYLITVRANGVEGSEEITIDCDGGVLPPGPGQTFSLDYTPAGGTFSIPVSKGATGFCRDQNGNIISCPTDLQVRWEVQGGPFGTNPSTGLTTTVSANTTGQSRICLVAVNYPSVAPVCFVWVAVQDSTPSPATLTVSPTTLNFQLAGSGCVATGAQPITISANNPVTIAVHNPSMANVSATRLEAGNDQRVFVNSVGNVAGSTQITVSSGGISRTVTVNLNGCAAQLSCADRSAAYVRSDGSGSYTINVSQPPVEIRLTQQDAWPLHCDVVYMTDRASILMINGQVSRPVCSPGGCFYYFMGKKAYLDGVSAGSALGISKVVLFENMGQSNERWVFATGPNVQYSQTWNVVASTLDALGMKMPEGPKWVMVGEKKVCLTFECR